ncbi:MULTISPECIES: hypothetical protein [unclassified Nocardiopsis]|uniref:hypothetical protein n=1 Tax=unclassified Nocardiopsis TaxID=2649073 RepID=UPI0013580A4E|nr:MULTISPECIES: hypothetical protein [unclassified Nocardiopsis]
MTTSPRGATPQARGESPTPDPLVTAIANGSLTGSQRRALADLVQFLVSEMGRDSIARPGNLMEQTIDQAGSWGTLRSLWRTAHRDLYPEGVRA